IHLSVDPHQRGAIDVTSMIAAASSLSWGTLALLWGVAALAAVFDAPGDACLPWPRLTTAALGTVIALICVAPIGRLLGLRIDVWTLLGLFGLAIVAYLIDLSYRRIRDRLKKRN
ncbi:MAG: hypothetical protein KAI47_20500, partial [Deltaproteobacteria bacterium]|nr:hypothetical protein [Deltaproteobacteria bacterium]